MVMITEQDMALAAKERDESNSFDDLPEGWYYCEVEKSEDKVSKAGNQMLSIQFNVVAPRYKGRKVFHHILYQRDFGLKQLREMAMAVSPNGAPVDSSQFVGKIIWFRLTYSENANGEQSQWLNDMCDNESFKVRFSSEYNKARQIMLGNDAQTPTQPQQGYNAPFKSNAAVTQAAQQMSAAQPAQQSTQPTMQPAPAAQPTQQQVNAMAMGQAPQSPPPTPALQSDDIPF